MVDYISDPFMEPEWTKCHVGAFIIIMALVTHTIMISQHYR